MLTAIVGINWGDEGKGRMVDLLSEQYDIVCRYQGGNNAGHTVINDRGKFVLNLLPSGILRERSVNVLGAGMVIDIEHLVREISNLQTKGIKISPDNLKLSSRAFITLPYHVKQDVLEEERLGDKKFGSTRRGIAPAYSDKYSKKGIRIGDLLDPVTLRERVEDLVLWKNLTLAAYGSYRANAEEIFTWLRTYGEPLLPYITNTTEFLHEQVQAGKDILFEAQLGALRDIDYGIYPYTTSSQTLAAYATYGAGVPGLHLDKVIGVMKAYSSCVGEGPFTAEMFGAEAEILREAGAEYGAATGRPRRVGGFDVVASRYGVAVQGADELALTKLDILSGYKQIPVCTAYEIDGERTMVFPEGERLQRAKPVYEYLPGFGQDISHCRREEELPTAALAYIKFIEQQVGCKIRYVSVGADREQYVTLR